MAIALPTLITDAGRDAAIAADNLGLKLRLTHIAVAGGDAEPAFGWTELDGEIARFEILSGAHVGPAQLQVSGVLEPDASYVVRSIGVFAADGTLFAVGWRLPAGIFHASPEVPYPVMFDLVLDRVPLGSVTVEATLNLDLAFVGPIAALNQSVASITRRQIDDNIRIRSLRGRPTRGMEKLV